MSGFSFSVIDKDRGWKDLLKRIAEVKQSKAYAKVGVMGGEGGEGMTAARLAAIHEFGATIIAKGRRIVIPERSFLRATIDANREKYLKGLERLIAGFYEGKGTISQILGLLGQQASKDVRERIRAGISQENAPSTIARNGSSTPLIDTGRNLLARITYKVVGDGEE